MKTMGKANNNSLHLDFHRVIKVRADDVTNPLHCALNDAYGMFLLDEVASEFRPDIVLTNRRATDLLDLAPKNIKNVRKFWVTERENEFCIVYDHKGKAELLIKFADPVELYYTPRSRAAKVMDCLYVCLQLALYRKGGLVFHGAALCKREHCIVLTGLWGAGKTSMILNMLHDGWGYLSDNTFLLYDGKAHIFRKRIAFHHYHMEKYPWIFPQRLNDKRMIKYVWLRKNLRRLAISYLPHYVHQSHKLKRLYDPAMGMDPKDLFPKCNIVQFAIPTTVLVLRSGAGFGFASIDNGMLVRKVTALQEINYQDFQAIGRLKNLYGYGTSFDIGQRIEANLGDTSGYGATIPYDVDPQELRAELRNWLDQITQE